MAAPVDLAVEHYPLNETGKDYVVGDIHGCFTKLLEELKKLGFDESKDRLFATGDLVDRGPESHLVAHFIQTHPWFHSVRGNHEDMALQNRSLMARDPMEISLNMFDCRNGMGWWGEQPYSIRRDCFTAIKKLPIAIDVMTSKGLVGIVHSEVPGVYRNSEDFYPVCNWSEFLVRLSSFRHEIADEVMWSRDTCKYDRATDVEGAFRVYAGHTPLYKPKVLGNLVYIDTGACFEDGYFTIMEPTKEL